MCFLIPQIYELLYCFLTMINRMINVTAMFTNNMIHSTLLLCYNVLSSCLQVVSIVPIMCMFALTSRMTWLMCRCGFSCQRYSFSFMCILAMILFYYLYFNGHIDNLLFLMGYQKKHTTMVERTGEDFMNALNSNETLV